MSHQESQIYVRQQTMNVYFCGGAGINIGCKWYLKQKESIAGIAESNCVFIDTSISNIRSTIPPDKFYRIDGEKEGSGKRRIENAESIMNNAQSILNEFPASDVNLVVSSISGGSGSVIAPALVDELLRRNQIVVVLMVSSTDTDIELYNSIKTIQSYEKISRDHKKPIVAFYECNNELSQQEVDNEVMWAICWMSIITGTLGIEGAGLDKADLYNLFNFQRVTSVDAHLTKARFGYSTATPSVLPEVVSMLTIRESRDGEIVCGTAPVRAEYRSTVDIPATSLGNTYPSNLLNEGPMNLYIHNCGFVDIFTEFSNKLKEIEAKKKTRQIKSTILSDSDGASNDKLVF